MNPSLFINFSLLWLLTVTSSQLVAVEDDNGVTNKCLDKERHALLLFKAPLKDPDGWLSLWRVEDDECCKWSGVTCSNQTSHVTKLNIKNYNLEGEISHSLVNLSYLNLLDLSSNSFHGNIPTFIGSMTRLISLDLSYNSFYGNIPPELGNLTNLEVLRLRDVGRCRVENIEWLSRLSNLEELKMDGISLAKQNYWVDVIFSLQKLSYVHLWGCELSQLMANNFAVVKFPDFLNNLSGCASLTLQELSAPTSQLTGLLSDEIQKFSSLKYLDLSHNHFNGTISAKLWELPRLETLDVSFNTLRAPTIDHFSSLFNGKYMYMSSCKLGPHFPKWIQTLRNLTALDLCNTGISDTVPMDFWDMWPSQLRYLNLSSNNISGKVPDLSSILPTMQQ
ncbi:hypothetical protein LXL04_004569 [Taraxacum kok-saghyz]